MADKILRHVVIFFIEMILLIILLVIDAFISGGAASVNFVTLFIYFVVMDKLFFNDYISGEKDLF